jgi:hypothetical protein
VHKTDSDETFHSVKLHRMVGLNVRKWGFYDKTVKNFKPFCWWDAFRSVWMTQQNAPSELLLESVYLPALPTLIFAKYNFPSIMFSTFFKFKGQNRKNIVFYSFYKPFCRTCLLYSTRRCAPLALKNACKKMVL